MKQQHITLVRTSFEEVRQERPDFANYFYTRLFELDPTLRPLFASGIRSQGDKLMAMLATVIDGLDRLDVHVPAIEALAVRHVAYGVAERHYTTVGAALIDTIVATLKDKCTEDVRQAWLEAYGLLSTVMIAASKAAGAAGRRAA